MIRALRDVNWRVFGILLAGGMLGVVAVLPFMWELVPRMAPAQESPSLPMPLVIVLALVQNALLLGVAIAAGMVFASRVGLTMPFINAWAHRQPPPTFIGIALPAVGLGAAAGVVIVTIEVLFFLHHLPAPIRASFDIPLWKRLLAGVLYGGITEELFMRLFLLSLLAWLLARWWKTPAGRPTPGAFWTAIVVVAFIFGLGHLPATSLMASLTPALIARALVLNGIAGVAFGYLYWRYGLEAAMLGHMSVHLILQVPGAMLIARML